MVWDRAPSVRSRPAAAASPAPPALPALQTLRRFRRAAPIRATFAQASMPTPTRSTMVAGTVSQPALAYSARDLRPAVVHSIPPVLVSLVPAAQAAAAASRAPALFTSTTGRSPVLATQHIIRTSPGLAKLVLQELTTSTLVLPEINGLPPIPRPRFRTSGSRLPPTPSAPRPAASPTARSP